MSETTERRPTPRGPLYLLILGWAIFGAVSAFFVQPHEPMVRELEIKELPWLTAAFFHLASWTGLAIVSGVVGVLALTYWVTRGTVGKRITLAAAVLLMGLPIVMVYSTVLPIKTLHQKLGSGE